MSKTTEKYKWVSVVKSKSTQSLKLTQLFRTTRISVISLSYRLDVQSLFLCFFWRHLDFKSFLLKNDRKFSVFFKWQYIKQKDNALKMHVREKNVKFSFSTLFLH